MSDIFTAKRFENFCSHMRISTKEKGEIPLRFMGTQRYLIQEIEKGLKDGIHNFIVLKGRQLGVSTGTIALDLFWLFTHRGLQGALVTDTDSNRDLFRSYVVQYLNTLPRHLKVPIKSHNRSMLELKNNSIMAYMTAGTRKGGGLGRGHAVNFLHATECSSWGDEEGLASLYSTLAAVNPDRFYLFESTARGYNMYWEMYEGAKESSTQKAIFIGWWRNEFYQIMPNTPAYRMYWDGRPTSDERVWITEIYETYKHNITDRQLAWWRWKLAEEIKDENLMFQEFPPTEQYAFQMTGSKFFSTERINFTYRKAEEAPYQSFRYQFGLHFEETQFVETNEQTGWLRVFEKPVPDGVYVLGADPAYGSSEWADRFVASVWRCFADRAVQAAEFATADLTEAQFAWVIAHLGGWFRPCMIVLEMQGPGHTVFNELNNLKRWVSKPNTSQEVRDAYEVLANIRDYLWKRPDSLGGGLAYQFQSNSREKLNMLSSYRNYFEREMLGINSTELCSEMRQISRDGDQIGGAGRAKDDRVIAAGLAIEGWSKWIMPEMAAGGRTFEVETRPAQPLRAMTAVENSVLQYFRRNGIDYVRPD